MPKIPNIIGAISTFLKEIRTEVKKVNWPTRKETIRYTLIILGISLVVALYLGVIEFIFTDLLNCFIFKGECTLSRFLPFLR